MEKYYLSLKEISNISTKQRQNELDILSENFKIIINELKKPSKNQLTSNYFVKSDSEIDYAQKWIIDMLQYNLVDGKLNRAVLLLSTYHIIKPNCSKEQIANIAALGWCVEMFQTYFLILDDIMDNSLTRRGKDCWYKKENVGMIAVNDATLLQSIIFNLLERHFKNVPFYNQLTTLFNEAFRITAYGQCLDVLTEKNSKITVNNIIELNFDEEMFTEKRYDTIVKYKTSFYSFVLPIRLAMYAADMADLALHKNVEQILLKIGHIFQIQDDYLDCFADSKVLGKIGTDIRNGKCSWLIVKALQHANKDDEINELKKNYGLNNPESEQIIKNLYKKLNLVEHYNRTIDKYIEEIFQEIKIFNQIYKDQITEQLFYQSLEQIFKRQK